MEICDKCRKEKPNYYYFSFLYPKLALCGNCYKKLKEWLDKRS